jgi:hypothetical protein
MRGSHASPGVFGVCGNASPYSVYTFLKRRQGERSLLAVAVVSILMCVKFLSLRGRVCVSVCAPDPERGTFPARRPRATEETTRSVSNHSSPG